MPGSGGDGTVRSKYGTLGRFGPPLAGVLKARQGLSPRSDLPRPRRPARELAPNTGSPGGVGRVLESRQEPRDARVGTEPRTPRASAARPWQQVRRGEAEVISVACPAAGCARTPVLHSE